MSTEPARTALRPIERRRVVPSLGLTLVAALLLGELVGGCALFMRVDTARSGSERTLLKIARDLRDVPRATRATGELADPRVEALVARARSIWADSPARSALVAGREDSGYEIGAVFEAVADYYIATGRTGRAIPYLEEATAEARALRYYTQWQELTLELVGLYQRLGMVDHARDRIASMLGFMERFGYSLERPPVEPGRDQVIFLQLHAVGLELRPETYRDAAQLSRLYDLFDASTSSSVEAWGWTPGDGYRFVGLETPFATRLAALGDDAKARRIREDLERRHRWNRETDPFVLANEKGLDSFQTRLGRDLLRLVEQPFATKVAAFTVRLADRPPSERRYVERAGLRAGMDRARIDLALGEARAALEEATRAETALAEVERAYVGLASTLAAEDRLELTKRALLRLRARIDESLGEYARAEARYEDYVAWSERERASLPVEQRIHFFRGQALEAYRGAIRCSLRLHLETGDRAHLDRALGQVERMRSRGFQDLLGIESERSAVPSVARVRDRLEAGEGVLQLIDLGSEVATIFLSRDVARAQLRAKPLDFDTRIFALRNRLAEDRIHDRAAFDRLGPSLLGFVSEPLARASTLFVATDGALTALPPAILPYAPGQLLNGRATITVLPSLTQWLAAEPRIALRQRRAPRAYVVADPIFEVAAGSGSGQAGASTRSTRAATRGDAALAYFQRLPETADEARAVLAALGQGSGEGDGQGGRLLLGAEALESRIHAETDLRAYTHLHFATHGVIGRDLPDLAEPALVLGWEPGEDGFLTASEVAALDLDAELTVLSACNTGNGEYFAGEGLMGMGRAFLLAGSKQVVVSLWPVDSHSTERLMTLFYERLALGETAAVALWQAQRALQNEGGRDGSGDRGIALSGGRVVGEDDAGSRYANPFYWSPFVLVSTR